MPPDLTSLAKEVKNDVPGSFRKLITVGTPYVGFLINIYWPRSVTADKLDTIWSKVGYALSLYSPKKPEPFTGWLRRVVINECIDQRRKRRTCYVDEVFDENGIELFFEQRTPSETPYNILMRSQQRDALEYAASHANMSEQFRLAFESRYIDECTHDEIAQLYGIGSINTVKTRIHRGKNEVKAYLRAYYGEDPLAVLL